MDKPTNVDLETSEAALLQAASRIFAAYVIRKEVTVENEDSFQQKAVDIAIAMAKAVDVRVETGDEVRSTLGGGESYRPLG